MLLLQTSAVIQPSSRFTENVFLLQQLVLATKTIAAAMEVLETRVWQDKLNLISFLTSRDLHYHFKIHWYLIYLRHDVAALLPNRFLNSTRTYLARGSQRSL